MLRKLLKSKSENSQVLYNTLGTVIRSSISFFTMPLFTRLLGADQYGLYSVYSSWVLIFTCFMGGNVGSGLGTGLYRYSDDYRRFKTSTLVEGTVISGIVVCAALLFYILFGSVFPYPFIIFVAMLLESYCQFVANFSTLSWTYEKRAGLNMLVSVLTLLSTSIFSIALITNWKTFGSDNTLYYGRVFGTLIPSVLISAFLWVFVFKEQPFGYNKEYWKYSIGFGIPMVFHSLSQNVLSQSDRVMMQSYGTANSEIGIYSFFYAYCMILGTLLTALNNSWCPFLYDGLKKKEYKSIDKKIKNYVEVFTTLCVGFLLLSREVAQIFADSEYWEGMALVPIIVLVVYFTYMYQFPVNYEFYNSKPRIVAIGTVIAGLVNIILNSLLIPSYGMYGASAATLISYVALALIHYAVVNHWKLEKYPLTNKPVLYGLVVVVCACLAYYLLAEYWSIRWPLAVFLGVRMIYFVKKRGTIF